MNGAIAVLDVTGALAEFTFGLSGCEVRREVECDPEGAGLGARIARLDVATDWLAVPALDVEDALDARFRSDGELSLAQQRDLCPVEDVDRLAIGTPGRRAGLLESGSELRRRSVGPDDATGESVVETGEPNQFGHASGVESHLRLDAVKQVRQRRRLHPRG